MSERIPTIIAGIGGIGCQIAANVFKMMNPDDAEVVSIVGIDTDHRALNEYRDMGMTVIEISQNKNVDQYLKENPEFDEWFPRNPFLDNRGMSDGAGQVRALSRLAALCSDKQKKFDGLKREIERIMKNRGTSQGTQHLTVMIVGSVTGGTGAGMFIQLPLYIREMVKDVASLNSVLIRGMFIGADITDKVAPGDDNVKAVHVNDYTCMKELNAFYLNQTRDKESVMIDLEHYDKNSYPYDYLFLLQNGGEMGTHGNAPLEEIIQKAGEMVYFQLLTPIIGHSRSAEDNFVLSLINKNGMNRYASVGLSRIIYPYEEVKEYCALSWINSLVGENWLLLDREYFTMTKDAAVQRQTDPYYQMPDRQETFMTMFKEQCGAEGNKKSCPLSSLREEAFTRLGEMSTVYEDKSENYFDSIEAFISETLQSPDVLAKKNRCKVKEDEMSSVAKAKEEIGRCLSARSVFQEELQKQVQTSRTKILAEVMPGSMDSVIRHKDEDYNIYNLLAEVHPLTARYFLYSLRAQLTESMDDHDVTLCNKNVLELVENTDFLEAVDNKQSPSEAADYFLAKMKKSESGIWNKVTSIFNKETVDESEEFHDFTALFKKTMTQWITSTENYYLSLLAREVLENIRDYVDILIDLYERFFDSLENIILENKDQADQITEQLGIDELGVKRVCCDKESLAYLFGKLEAECIQDKMALPKTVKQSVFRELYTLFVNKRNKMSAFDKQITRRKEMEKEKSAILKLFNKSVASEIRNQIEEVGTRVLDRNVKQMIMEEYEVAYLLNTKEILKTKEIPEKLRPDNMELEDGKKEYLQYVVGKGLNLADPWILTNNSETPTFSAYVGINESVAVMKAGNPDQVSTHAELLSPAYANFGKKQTGLLMGDEFSKYEIVCYKARYVMMIEELIRYAPDSYNAQVYAERLANINGTPTGSGEDAYKSVINPHLCCYWNEEAYIPALYDYEREQEKKDSVRAFIYAMALDLCRKGRDEDDEECLTWKLMVGDNADVQSIKVHDVPIANGHHDLYNSLKYNRAVKNQLMERGNEAVRKEKLSRNMDTIEEDILEHELIRDFTFNNFRTFDENMIDMLKKMRTILKEQKLDEDKNKSEFDYLCDQYIEFIIEYCQEMIGKSPSTVRRVYGKIVDRIIENSEVMAEIARKKEEFTEEMAEEVGTNLSADEEAMEKLAAKLKNGYKNYLASKK